MFKVTPDNPTIQVASSPTKATLHAYQRPTYDLPIALPTPPSVVSTLGPVPTTAPNGVYRLRLTTDCGCSFAFINVEMCPQAAFPQPTPPAPPTQPVITECCPGDEPPADPCLGMSVTASAAPV